jgi:hypothetical protein
MGALVVGNSSTGPACYECDDATPVYLTDFKGAASLPAPWAMLGGTTAFDANGMYVSPGSGQSSVFAAIGSLSVPMRSMTLAMEVRGINSSEVCDMTANDTSGFQVVYSRISGDFGGYVEGGNASGIIGPQYDITAPWSGLSFIRYDSCGTFSKDVFVGGTLVHSSTVDNGPMAPWTLNRVGLSFSKFISAGASARIAKVGYWNCALTDAQLATVETAW